MRISVLNGPNLNLLGSREPEIYGGATLEAIEVMVRAAAGPLGCDVAWFQSNHEGALVDAIQARPQSADGLILYAGAYTHTSGALRDALLAVKIPFVEVHLSNVFARDAIRHQSLMADLAVGVVAGFGPEGYVMALQGLYRALS